MAPSASKLKKASSNKDELYEIKSITGKAIRGSRLCYGVEWLNGSKPCFQYFESFTTSLLTIKNFEEQFAENRSRKRAFKAQISTIKRAKVKKFRNQLEFSLSVHVHRIFAFCNRTQKAIVHWDNNMISCVHTKKCDPLLRAGIGLALHEENEQLFVNNFIGGTAVRKPHLHVRFNDNYRPDVILKGEVDKECAEICENFFKKMSPKVNEIWIKEAMTEDDGPFELYTNRTYPLPPDAIPEGYPGMRTVTHTMCDQCGKIWQYPCKDMYLHLLTKGHMGWHLGVVVSPDVASKYMNVGQNKAQVNHPATNGDQLSPEQMKPGPSGMQFQQRKIQRTTTTLASSTNGSQTQAPLKPSVAQTNALARPIQYFSGKDQYNHKTIQSGANGKQPIGTNHSHVANPDLVDLPNEQEMFVGGNQAGQNLQDQPHCSRYTPTSVAQGQYRSVMHNESQLMVPSTSRAPGTWPMLEQSRASIPAQEDRTFASQAAATSRASVIVKTPKLTNTHELPQNQPTDSQLGYKKRIQ